MRKMNTDVDAPGAGRRLVPDKAFVPGHDELELHVGPAAERVDGGRLAGLEGGGADDGARGRAVDVDHVERDGRAVAPEGLAGGEGGDERARAAGAGGDVEGDVLRDAAVLGVLDDAEIVEGWVDGLAGAGLEGGGCGREGGREGGEEDGCELHGCGLFWFESVLLI